MTEDIEKAFKARIRNLAREQNIDPAILWQNLVLERFLVRLIQSRHASQFILKGGILLSKILKIERETKDLDFSLRKNLQDAKKIKEIFEEIAQIRVKDGFSFENVRIEELLHSHMKYAGKRISMIGYFGKTRFKVCIDLGYGDLVEPIELKLPLAFSKKGAIFESHIEIKCYPLEFIFAEKIQTIISRKGKNSRMKDFHDLYAMILQKGDQLKNISKIVRKVFEHRQTDLLLPIMFSGKELKNMQIFWKAYLRGLKSGHSLPNELQEIISSINKWIQVNTNLSSQNFDSNVD
ncbi:MAG: nucleotidyl transferase AbiEii/AbiGii toxin family protein [Chlamydiota bacterium]|jgi:predicted nucleotidyltransferase component of viral defense system